MLPLAMLALGAAGSLIGNKQTGAPAPAHTPAQAPQGANEATQALIRKQMMGQQQSVIPLDLARITGSSGQMGQPQMGQMGPPMPQMEQQQMGPPPGGMMGRVGGFFDNMDHNLQSPSKQLGIGLLGQINPYLGAAGLIGSGLFGGRR